MKILKVLFGLILTTIVLTPLATSAKEYNMIYGGNIEGGIYVSGNGSYTSAYNIVKVSNSNVKNISTSIERIDSKVTTKETRFGKNESEIYIQGGANSIYNFASSVSKVVVE